jgi:hypothetical protein
VEARGARSGAHENGRPSQLRVNTNGGCPSNSSLTYDANPDLCEHNASLCGSGGWEGHSQNGKVRFLRVNLGLRAGSQKPNLFCTNGRKDSAHPRVSLVLEANSGAARRDWPPTPD